MKLSFVIPHYGKSGNLVNCLSSLRKFHADDEVIVVDDCTGDNSIPGICELFNAKYIANEENRGFSKTCNRGMKESNGDVIVLTNNDIIFTKNVGSALDFEFSRPEVGIVGALLYYPDGRIQHAGVYGFEGNFLHYGHRKDPDKSLGCFFSRYCFSVTGAFYAIKREVIERIGYLSEEYKNSCEDTNYSVRAWLDGFRVVYSPDFTAIHAEGATRGKTQEEKVASGNAKDDSESTGKLINWLNRVKYRDIIRRVAQLNSDEKVPGIKEVAIKRTMAMGDVQRAANIKFPNDIKVSFITRHPYVLQGVEGINEIYTSEDECPVDGIIDLDYVYEMKPDINIEQAYLEEVRRYIPEATIRMNPIKSGAYDRFAVRSKVPDFNPSEKYVAVCASRSNASRTWPKEYWVELIKTLYSKGYNIVSLGTQNDYQFGIPVVNACNKLSVTESHAVIEGADIFIGMDSGLLHVAETTGTDCIGIFTSVKPSMRLSTRERGKTYAVVPDLPCVGCVRDHPVPLTTCPPCHYDYRCVKEVTPAMILEVVKRIEEKQCLPF